MPPDVFAIPVEDKFILYRPLLQVAFVGNQAIADLVLDLVKPGAATSSHAPVSEEALSFLRTVGFLDPSPPPPPLPDTEYRPTVAVLLLTNRCNLRCTYCYAGGGEGLPRLISLDSACAVIDCVYRNAIALGRPHFELTFHGGGEPVQAWDIVQVATAYARSKDLPCRTSMVSNGVWTQPQRDWILHNVDSLTISFDGRPETQNRQRPFATGQGSFKSVMRTIRKLDQARFSYGIRMTAMPPWGGGLVEDVRFICENIGCTAIQVEPAFNHARGQFQGPTTDESKEFIEAFMEAFEVAQHANRHMTFSGARPWLLAQTFCTAPYGALIVNPDGNLVACYEVVDNRHPLAWMSIMGRVSDSQIVEDSKARWALFEYLGKNRTRCQGCFCYWHCAGDCYTRAYFAGLNAVNGSNPRCDMNRKITARILLWYIMNGNGVWQGQDLSSPTTEMWQTF